jgi:hypothetical protein
VGNRVEVELFPGMASRDGRVVLRPHGARPGNPPPNVPCRLVGCIVCDDTDEAS